MATGAPSVAASFNPRDMVWLACWCMCVMKLCTHVSRSVPKMRHRCCMVSGTVLSQSICTFLGLNSHERCRVKNQYPFSAQKVGLPFVLQFVSCSRLTDDESGPDVWSKNLKFPSASCLAKRTLTPLAVAFKGIVP